MSAVSIVTVILKDNKREMAETVTTEYFVLYIA